MEEADMAHTTDCWTMGVSLIASGIHKTHEEWVSMGFASPGKKKQIHMVSKFLQEKPMRPQTHFELNLKTDLILLVIFYTINHPNFIHSKHWLLEYAGIQKC